MMLSVKPSTLLHLKTVKPTLGIVDYVPNLGEKSYRRGVVQSAAPFRRFFQLPAQPANQQC